MILALALMGPAAAQTLAPVDEAGFRKLVAAHKGKVLIVDFWATWCQPCRKEMPQLLKLTAAHRARGLELVTISADEPETEKGAVEFLRKIGVSWPAYIKRPADDDKFINAIDPKWSGALPALFVYDRQGRNATSFIGETDMAALEAVLKKLL